MKNPRYNGWREKTPDAVWSFCPGTYAECVKESFPYFPFWVRVDREFYGDEVAEWCFIRFGVCGLNKRRDALALRYPAYWVDLTKQWAAFTGDYLFMHSDHAFEFKMRWL